MDRRTFARIALPLTTAAFVAGLARDVPAAPPAPEDIGGLRTAAPPAPPASSAACSDGMVAMPSGGWSDPPRSPEVFHVAPFCLDLTEVTVDAYKGCVDARVCTEPHLVRPSGVREPQCNWGRPDRGRHPINCVDWYQASAYCASVGKHLPSVAELEWAARNGDEGTLYPWGDAAPSASLVNACGPECFPRTRPMVYDQLGQPVPEDSDRPLYAEDDGFVDTAPVGSFPKGDNRWGVHDLAGNVFEWTATKLDGPAPPLFFLHGGSYRVSSFYAGVLKSFGRGHAPATDHAGSLGLRCAR